MMPAMSAVPVYTIGFTKTSAKDFFERLRSAGVRRVLDVRLHNTSQLSGFAKSDDLSYFLETIGGIEYSHEPSLAPTDDMLKAYKRDRGDWVAYQASFLGLMQKRRVEQRLAPGYLRDSCLLCSEFSPHHCHRRLVCEYLNDKWGGPLSVLHL